MKIFIAGSTGVLGRRVIPRLLGSGHQVVGLSRSPENDDVLRRLGAEPRPGDLFDAAGISHLSEDCHAILHLATAIPTKSRISSRDWRLNDRIRREGTANLIAAAVRNRCGLYLQQSVIFLYGDRDGEWVDEDSPVAREQPTMLQSAVDMEHLVFGAIRRRDLPAVILRFGSFYAHDSAQTVSTFNGIAKGRVPIIGNGRAYWNMLNIDDAADAVVRAVLHSRHRAGNVFNICDNEPVLYRDFIDLIARSLNAPKPRRIPPFIAGIAIGRELVRVLLSSVRGRNSKATSELGWRPRYPSVREGIPAEVARWSKQRG